MMGPLTTNILLFYGILFFINVPAYFLGLRFEGNEHKRRLWFEPPGFVIPIVWVFLFLLLAILRYKLVQIEADYLAKMTIGLAVVCASYAYYTLGLEKLTGISALKFGLIGNVVVILVALWVGVTVAELSSNLSYLVFPIVAWTFFATMIILGQLRLAKN
ncbi:MAG: TspO/MBR family protein [Algoriphagus sp.]|uniref:TspO/MBR family protein n=1 Tax=Algoriphagus sp. TaxID=1872435 RepID=UPI0027262D06|nr:TspO/MBR family protein [Algoriphagus sp.]MDO8966263.1 TspO/MBR family protein [Algoriphagus sp.]MDP2040376.1 TspO/MBR family protein [Algoriphagus sp.]MDP3201272.1 TspO/MBR family protein [Algoriphagus sp.]MDP3472832.1 TspO/MBR family protein [Algoriphagus sp.]